MVLSRLPPWLACRAWPLCGTQPKVALASAPAGGGTRPSWPLREAPRTRPRWLRHPRLAALAFASGAALQPAFACPLWYSAPVALAPSPGCGSTTRLIGPDISAFTRWHPAPAALAPSPGCGSTLGLAYIAPASLAGRHGAGACSAARAAAASTTATDADTTAPNDPLSAWSARASYQRASYSLLARGSGRLTCV
jgi:hypothetical protein